MTQEFRKSSPFKLLEPYQASEAKYFFGREKEVILLNDLLNRSKFVLMYGASGTGKTSLIQCGLSGMYAPRDWYPLFVRYNGDFVQSIENSLVETYKKGVPDGDKNEISTFTNLPLRDKIRALFLQSYRPIYLILDQFEELFILSADRENASRAFFTTLKELNLFSDDLFCKMILVCREEYLAHFYAFEKELPYLFENRFRLEKMRDEQMLSCIQRMVSAAYPGFLPIQMGEEVARQILKNIKTSKGDIELAELQIYLDRLYREDLVRKERLQLSRAHVLFDAELVREEDLSEVLNAFLNEQLEYIQTRVETGKLSQDLLLQILFKFVTTEGTKQNLSAAELLKKMQEGVNSSQYTKREIVLCLEKLLDPKIKLLNRLNQVMQAPERYEIMHDRMAACIFKRLTTTEIHLREAQQILQSRFKRYGDALSNVAKEYLTRGDLALIKSNMNIGALEAPEKKFVADSARYNFFQRLVYTLAILLGLSIVGGVIAWNSHLQFIENTVRNFVLHSKLQEDKNPVVALASLDSAFRYNPSSDLLIQTRKNLWLNQQFYSKRKKLPFSISAIEVSEDGQILLIVADKKIVRTNAQGRPLDSLVLASPVVAVRMLQNRGAYFVDEGKRVFFWPFQQHKAQCIDSLEASAYGMDLHSGSDRLAIVDGTGNLYLWQQKRRKNRNHITHNGIPLEMNYSGIPRVYPDHSLAFNPRGDRLISGIHSNSCVLMDLNARVVRLFPPIHKDVVLAVDYAPQAERVLTCSRDGQSHIWDISTPSETVQFPIFSRYSQKDRVNLGKFSQDGQHVILGYTNHNVQIWKLKHDVVYDYLGHNEKVVGANWLPGSDAFITASADSCLLWWKVSSHAKAVWGNFDFGIGGLCLIPGRNGLFAAAGTGELDYEVTIKNFDYEERVPLAPQFISHWLNGQKDALKKRIDLEGVNRIIALKDQNTIVIGGSPGTLYFWNLEKDQLRAIQTDMSEIRDLCLMDSGRLAVLGDQRIEIRAPDGRKIETLPIPDMGRMNCLQWSTVQQRLYLGLHATDNGSGLYTFYDRQWHQVQGYPSSVVSLGFSPDGQKLAAGTTDHFVYLGKINNIKAPDVLPFSKFSQDGSEKCYDLTFSPDGEKLALATKGGKCIVFNLSRKSEEMIFGDLETQGMFRVIFAPDGKSVYCGAGDGKVYQYLIPEFGN